jgi:hypothetical protein
MWHVFATLLVQNLLDNIAGSVPFFDILVARELEFSPVIAETLHAQRHRVWYVRLYLLLPTAFSSLARISM